MPRNGSGSYNLPSGNPVVASTVISSTWANNTLSDIGTALTSSIANDGQTVPVANLPMAAFRHTNVANAQNRNEYAAAGQVQDGALQWLTSVAGTNTITASITPSPSAYTAGQTFRFTAAGANTGAVTLNINGLGAKAVTRNGTTPLVSGDIPSGAVIDVTYDGTQFQMDSGVTAGKLTGIQTFTSSGTYTPTTGTRYVLVEVLGGGGGGGAVPASGATASAAGAGGQAGAFARGLIATGFSGVTVTVGTAGPGGSAGLNGGTAGGNSSFGALITAPGGGGGNAGPTVTGTSCALGGNGGARASGATIYNGFGAYGGNGLVLNGTAQQNIGGPGGASHISAGGTAGTQGNNPGGNAGANTGGGGGGATNINNGAAQAGGAGGTGIVVVYEFA